MSTPTETEKRVLIAEAALNDALVAFGKIQVLCLFNEDGQSQEEVIEELVPNVADKAKAAIRKALAILTPA